MRFWVAILLLVTTAAMAKPPIVWTNAMGQVIYRREIPRDGRLGKWNGTGLKPQQFYRWDPLITEASLYYGIDPYYVKAILLAENRLRAKGTSKAGAIGIAQLMPKTAKRLGVRDPRDPREGIWGCAAYLRQASDQFGGNLILMAAAYNAGSEAVKSAGHRVPELSETMVYVPRVLWTWDRLQRQQEPQ